MKSNDQDKRFYNTPYSFMLHDFMSMCTFYVALMNLLYMY